MEKNKFTHGSLFSGIGGPEIAAEEMGWKNMFHCEINPFGRKILDYWFPNSKSYEDITKTNFTEWRGKINVLTGGFPCQPFSCAGQRKGADKYSKKYNPNSQMGTALTAMAVNGMLPTPAARDYQPSVSPQALKRKNGKMRTDALCNLPVMLGEHHSQNGGKTSQLNPLFVAEMMGFPPDWTVLPFQSGGRNR